MAQKPRWGELEEEADGGDYDYLLPPKQDVGAKLTMVSTEEIIFERPRAPVPPHMNFICNWKHLELALIRFFRLQVYKYFLQETRGKVAALLKQQGAFAKVQIKTAPVKEEVPPLLGENGKIEVWHIDGEEKTELPKEDIGKFYSGDCYICLYSYHSDEKKEDHYMCCWIGKDSIQEDQKTAVQQTTSMFNSMKCHAVGSGAKILHGEAALAHYLSQHLIDNLKGNLEGIFAPGWIGYGNAYASKEADDQAMSGYCTIARLFPGCHLPKLAEQFFLQANAICPSDPLVMNKFIGHTKDVMGLINWTTNCLGCFLQKLWMLFKTLIGSFLLEMLLQSSMSFIHMMMSILHYFTES
ncbi:unnamed protein product [Lactuca saligna]|uniref:Gelsolin-like domain-containing protein n=1 Tax=Lactuca saligna TaxID=75948 RepID=A0AA36DW75_LACSI|nr:unnamed protein product [Lactuca saligna]